MPTPYQILNVAIIVLYGLLGCAAFHAGKPREGALALMFCVSNALIFFGR